jgi:hypothetical protein
MEWLEMSFPSVEEEEEGRTSRGQKHIFIEKCRKKVLSAAATSTHGE